MLPAFKPDCAVFTFGLSRAVVLSPFRRQLDDVPLRKAKSSERLQPPSPPDCGLFFVASLPTLADLKAFELCIPTTWTQVTAEAWIKVRPFNEPGSRDRLAMTEHQLIATWNNASSNRLPDQVQPCGGMSDFDAVFLQAIESFLEFSFSNCSQ
jgi:hypothetical protein